MSETPHSESQNSSSASASSETAVRSLELPMTTAEERHASIEQAFDYRGDVTLTTRDGRTLEGYLFDRRNKAGVDHVRMMLPDGSRHDVAEDQIVRMVMSDRDPAAGKSWETWLKKYVEKKRKGEKITNEHD